MIFMLDLSIFPPFNLMTQRKILFMCTFTLFAIILKCGESCGHDLKSEESSDYVLCRQCGADIADASYLNYQFSPAALIQGNQSLFNRENVEVLVLQNPSGIRFQIITLAKANCVGVENWHLEHSWFPGYAWKPCLCVHCGHHLGWVFEPASTATGSRKVPSSSGFYALILDSVLSETYSLMIIPRSYRS